MSVSYPCPYLYCSPSSDSKSNSESEKQSKLYLEFNFSISASHCLWNFCLTWIFVFLYLLVRVLCVLGLLIVQGLRASCLGHLHFWLGWCLLLKLVLVFAIPIFLFLILAEGTIWSPSTFLCFWAND